MICRRSWRRDTKRKAESRTQGSYSQQSALPDITHCLFVVCSLGLHASQVEENNAPVLAGPDLDSSPGLAPTNSGFGGRDLPALNLYV